jgi:hypothetical protein
VVRGLARGESCIFSPAASVSREVVNCKGSRAAGELVGGWNGMGLAGSLCRCCAGTNQMVSPSLC